MDKAHAAKEIVLKVHDLQSISSSALRYLGFYKQKAGGDFTISMVGASAIVRQAIMDSELIDEVILIG
jgi:hypothetical protein